MLFKLYMYLNLTVKFSTEISICVPQNKKRSDLNKIKYSFTLYDNFQELIADFKLSLNVNKVSNPSKILWVRSIVKVQTEVNYGKALSDI